MEIPIFGLIAYARYEWETTPVFAQHVGKYLLDNDTAHTDTNLRQPLKTLDPNEARATCVYKLAIVRHDENCRAHRAQL